MTPELLTIPEAAEFLRMSTHAVYLAAYRGKLPGAVKLGGRWRVRRDDLRKALGLLPSPDPNHSGRG